MKLLLLRFAPLPTAMMGVLILPQGTVLWTVERPWKHNAPFVSCVPPGLYELEPHASQKFGPTWALVNHAIGVAHYPTPGSIRSAILLHAANTAEELQGCIAPGLAPQPGPSLGVRDSQAAMKRLREVLKTEGHAALEIVQTPAAYPPRRVA